jgi:hypothetical protein
MKKNLVRMAIMATFTAGLAGTLTGCIGSNAVTSKVMKFNLEVVDNRYARGGVNILLAPVYAITVALDAIIFNSVEFWAGKNPLNGKPHIFDSKMKTMLEVNKDLDPSLTEAPLDPITKADAVEKEVYTAQVTPIDENTLEFNITYNTGETALLRGKKDGEMVSFYMNDEFVTKVSMNDLNAYVENKA